MMTNLALENVERNNGNSTVISLVSASGDTIPISKEPEAGLCPRAKRLSKRRRGRLCLRKAKKAVEQTCTSLALEAREELVSALMPALWRRVRNWRPGEKSFADFAEQSAFQSLKDYQRRVHSSADALDRKAVGLEELGDGV